jgi:phosphoribosylaminoimidazole-succinocarboxamide synthase
MSARHPLYDGKAKTIFSTLDEQHLIQHFKDDATAFNAQKRDVIAGKGIVNNLISEHIMGVVAEAGIETHFIERLNDREQLIRKVEIIPIEVVIRNVAAGSIVKRLAGAHIPIEDGTPLPRPLLEYYLKEDTLNDPIITADHIIDFGLARDDELKEINRLSKKINDVLVAMFEQIGIRLIDFKLEFGRLPKSGNIILADEISPDNCRLWDIETNAKKDKDCFRHDLGGLIEAYTDIAARFGLDISAVSNLGADQ